MESLDNVLMNNKKTAIQYMKDNDVTHISFYGADGDSFLEEIPFVCLGDTDHDVEVVGVDYKDDDLFFILEEGKRRVSSDICTAYSANNVYEAIETYFNCYCDIHSKLHILNTALINAFNKLVPPNTELSTRKFQYPSYVIHPLNNMGFERMQITLIRHNSCIEFFDAISMKFYNMNDFAEKDLLDILYYFNRFKYKLEHQQNS